MTKKDYDLIAACIGAAQAQYDEHGYNRIGRDDLIDRLILEIKLNNPSFNEEQFWIRVEYWYAKHMQENNK